MRPARPFAVAAALLLAALAGAPFSASAQDSPPDKDAVGAASAAGKAHTPPAIPGAEHAPGAGSRVSGPPSMEASPGGGAARNPSPHLEASAPSPGTAPAGKDPEASLRMAILSMPDGDAKTRVTRSLDKAADQKTPEARAAVIRSEGGEIADAVGSADSWQGVKPEVRTRVTNAVAGALNTAGDYENSKSLSNDVLQREPDNRDALNNVAISHYYLQDYTEAIANATRAAKAAPDDATAYTTRAMAEYMSKDYLQAIEDSRKALALDKNDAEAFQTLKLAESHVGSSRLELTAAQRAQADAIRREYEQHLDEQAETGSQSRRRGPETASDGGAAAPAAPADPAERYNQQAAELEVQGRFPEALEVATKALGVNPRSLTALLIRARVENQAGQYDKAVADASAALAVDPANTAALDVRSRAYLRLERPADALQDCKRSAGLHPENQYAHANCARAHERLGELPEAIEDAKEAAALTPEFQYLYRKLLEEQSRGKARSPETPIPRLPPDGPARENPLRGYLVLVSLTLIGGLLIATGILHIVLGGRKAAAGTAAPAARAVRPIDNFRILRAIGRGGMGVVYEAKDLSLGRTVAVKKLRDEIKLDAAERERFLNEARTVAALRHPAIVEIHSIIEESDDLYLVFEYVSGKTVHEMLDQRKSFSLAEAKLVVRGICEALEYAHRHGVIHRDLKPSNIMVTDDGHVKVMDFGIARQAKDAVEKAGVTGTIIGTPQYMAPEAEQGVVRRELDVYSLGACLYEMLTGQRPFPGSSDTPLKLAMEYPKPSRLRQGLGPELDALIDAALQPDPDRRIRTPMEFMARLEAVPEPAVA